MHARRLSVFNLDPRVERFMEKKKKKKIEYVLYSADWSRNGGQHPRAVHRPSAPARSPASRLASEGNSRLRFLPSSSSFPPCIRKRIDDDAPDGNAYGITSGHRGRGTRRETPGVGDAARAVGESDAARYAR